MSLGDTYLGGEGVPEGGGFHTEGSVPKSVSAGVGGGGGQTSV